MYGKKIENLTRQLKSKTDQKYRHLNLLDMKNISSILDVMIVKPSLSAILLPCPA
jgi:hypothetical protein